MKIQAQATSDVGLKRDQNEDRHLIDRNLGLYIVCDGMGGHAAGEIAAAKSTRITAERIRDRQAEIDDALEKPGGHYLVVQIVADAVRAACRHLYALANSEPHYAGMGTTLTSLMILNGKGILAHVGDSRLYLLRNNELHLLSHDHTMAEEYARQSSEPIDPQVYKRFSNVLTRSLGPHEDVDVETLLFDVLPEDRFLICSDGLSNYFPGNIDKVVDFLSSSDFDAIPKRLTEFAIQSGGSDNITAVVVRAVSTTDTTLNAAGHYLDLLKQTFLFEGLSLTPLMRLVNICEVQSYDPKEWIIQKGDPRTGLYVIVEGQCRVAKPNGNYADMTTADCFGETALARGGEFQIQVQSSIPVKILHIPRDAFDDLVRKYSRMGRKLLNNLLDHISEQLDMVNQEAPSLSDTGIWEVGDDTESKATNV